MQCRACMQVNCAQVVEMTSTASDDGKTLYDYFNDCTQLEANSLDKLPQMLCTTCTRNLQVAYDFRQVARQSDKELKKLLDEQKAELINNATEQEEVIEHVLDEADDPLAVPEPNLVIPETPTDINDEQFVISVPDIKEELPEELVIEILNDDQIEEEFCDESMDDTDGEDPGNVTFSTKTICELCNSKHNSRNELRDHIYDKHKSDIICMKCPKVYEFPRDLQLHEIFVHGNESHLQCLWCKEFLTRDMLPRHFQLKHGNSYRKYFPRRRRRTSTAEGTGIWCDDCPQEFSTILELANHIKNHKFDCPICLMSFKKHGTYRAHLKRIHNRSMGSLKNKFEKADTEFICSLCACKFKLHKTFRLHMRNVHNEIISEFPENYEENVYECEICNLCFKGRTSVYLHKKRKHLEEGDTNDACEEEVKGKDSEDSDFSGEWDNAFKCYLCPRNFKLKRAYQDHMKNVHDQNIRISPKNYNKKLYECDICYSYFKNRSSVYLHKKRKHSEITEKTCADTENSTKEVAEDTENIEISECKYCHKQIPTDQKKNHERRHIYSMRGNQKFLCSFCPREYRAETTVRRHEKKVHLSEKPEPKECPICQKTLDPKYLRTHLANVHTSERKFVCDICGDSFKTYILLHSHKRLHLERNFHCTMCEKKFIRSFDLKVHMRIHTGEEPYACHLCDRRFKIKVRLNYHLQRHAGIKRKCNVCGKEFNHVKQLKIHSYKHTGMPYRCTVCDYGCAQRDVFRKHLLRMHDMTMTNEEYCAMFKANTGRNPHVKSLEELQSEAQNFNLTYLN